MANESLGNAKKTKNDEFYTVYDYIQKEMNAYLEYDPDVFRGKTVLLPCDDPEWSNFTKYFAQNFDMLGLKKLISTSYSNEAKNKYRPADSQVPYQLTLFDMESPLFDESLNKVRGKIYTLSRDKNASGDVDIDDLEWEYLEGDGDFRSDEVKALRDEADIIVTNPPFSLFREFIAWVMEAGKKVVVIGNQNAITYKEIFPLLKDNKLWIGATNNGQDMVFEVPEGAVVDPRDRLKAEKLGYKGNYTRLGNACWFTNIDHGRRHQPLALMTMADNLKFSKHKQIRETGYLRYDNYDAIEVPFVDAIPSDYVADMGVPITYLEKHNPEQFEIVKFRKGNDEKDLTYTITECDNPLTDRQTDRQTDTNYALLQNHHQTQDVTALWESRSPSSSDSTLNSSRSSEQPRAKERASQTDCGMPQAESHSHLSAASADTSVCLSEEKCNGVMGVPITFLFQHCPEQFEIVGLVNGKDDLVDISTTREYRDFREVRQDGEETGSNGNKIYGNPVLRGKPDKGNYFVCGDEIVYSAYARIFIRRR